MMEILLVWRHVHLIIVYQDLFANMFLSDLKYSEGRKEGRKDMFLVNDMFKTFLFTIIWCQTCV